MSTSQSKHHSFNLMIKLFFNILSQNIFAASIAVNMFSTTVLLITLTFLGHAEMAADVGIIQGATHAVFMAFSANARNLILGSVTDKLLSQQFFFRFYLLVPLSLIAYLLSSSVVGISSTIIIIFIFRRCNEWVAELQVTELEKVDNKKYAHQFFYLQVFSLLAVLAAFIFSDDYYYKVFLVIWAIAPIMLSAPFVTKIYSFKDECFNLELRSFLPHVGSSWVIAISVYVFRVLIVLLVGRAVAGILFSAYAIGGMLNSVYTYALGPSHAFNNQNNSGSSKFTRIAVSVLAVAGTVLCIFSYSTGIGEANTNFFIKSIGFSMIGGGIMILAQQRRIYMLQVLNSSVFVPDVISNILMICMLPIAFSIFGVESLPLIFMGNALLTYMFFSFTISGSGYDKWASKSIICGMKNRKIMQAAILFLLFLPIFFQLKNGLFNSPEMFFESYGGLTRLPLPLASIMCFVGIVFLTNFHVSRLSVATIFVFFVAMLMTTFTLYTINDSNVAVGKLLLVIQFILPTFALILGQSYEEPAESWFRFEAVFLYMLYLIVPAQIAVTIIQQTNLLSPYFYYFSIYQHLQYIPSILVGGYLLALFALFDNNVLRKLLLVLSPFMVVYVLLTTSLLAISLLAIGLLGAIFVFWKRYPIRFVIPLVALFVLMSVYLFNVEFNSKQSLILISKITSISQKNEILQPAEKNYDFSISFDERMQFWSWHFDGITENFTSLILGHEHRPDRTVIPSAHNYYLDLFYNFGLISLLPFIYLLMYSIKMYRARQLNDNLQKKTISLIAIVFFFVIIDNSLNVSFRQPYSGIFIFFLWGVLLNRLSASKTSKNLS